MGKRDAVSSLSRPRTRAAIVALVATCCCQVSQVTAAMSEAGRDNRERRKRPFECRLDYLASGGLVVDPEQHAARAASLCDMEFAQYPCYKELAGELVGMFAGEKRLTVVVLAVVGAAGCLIDFTGLNELFGGVVFTFWLCACADRECVPRGESADLGLANSTPRGVTNASSSPALI
jgi:hypothetical protein